MTTDPLIEDFALTWRSQGRAATTLRNYVYGLERIHHWLTARGSTLTEATRRDLEAYLAERLTQVSETTTHTDFKAMRAFYGWLADEDGVANPTARMRGPAVPEKVRHGATGDEYAKLLASCDAMTNKAQGRRDAAMIVLLWLGLRRGELCVLDMEHVDTVEGTITVPKTKTKRARTVAIPEADMLRRIQRWVRTRGREPGPLFTGKKGGLTPYGVQQAIAKHRKRAGVEATLHTFRHGRARDWLANGGSETLLMAHMGWTTTRMVDRYTREQQQQLAQEEARRLFGGKSNG